MSGRLLSRCARPPMHLSSASAAAACMRTPPLPAAVCAAAPGARFLYRRFASAAAAPAPAAAAALAHRDAARALGHFDAAHVATPWPQQHSNAHNQTATPVAAKSSLDAAHAHPSSTHSSSAAAEAPSAASASASSASSAAAAAAKATASAPATSSASVGSVVWPSLVSPPAAGGSSSSLFHNSPPTEPAVLQQLGMGEEELAALWRDYARSTSPALHSQVDRATFAAQCVLESSAVASNVAAYQEQAAQVIRMGRGTALGPAQAMLLSWYTPLVAKLQTELAHLASQSSSGGSGKAKGASDRHSMGPYLLQLSAPELACITMHELFGLCLNEPNGVKFLAACMRIGRVVNLEVKLSAIRANRTEWRGLKQALAPAGSATVGAAADTSAGANSAGGSGGAAGAASSHSNAAAHTSSGPILLTASSMAEVARRAKRLKSETWNDSVTVKVGSMLLNAFLKTAAIPADILFDGQEQENGAAEAAAAAGAAAADASHAAAGGAPNGIDGSPAASAPTSAAGAGSAAPRKKGPVNSVAPPPPFHPAFQHYYLLQSRNPGAGAGGSPSAGNGGPSGAQLGANGAGNGSGGAAGRSMVGMIRADPRVLSAVLADSAALDTLMPKLHPMLIAPKQWNSFDNGGYLTVRHKIVRSHGSLLQLDAVRDANLRPVYDAVNYLGSTPWQIHSEVWQVIQQLWSQGGGIADLPPRKDKQLPPEPARGDVEGKRLYESVRMYNSSLHSQRCDIEYKLRAASQFEGKKIYYPYFLDFRGRAYPIPPYLNHTGGDLSRGLLKFWNASPLGERGLYWLLVHLATLFGGGIDKAPFAARQAWSESHIADIRESVEKPLDGTRWWLQAEKPFQFLAACNELVKALRCPDPTKFMSTLPVHTDGSCNGLQHYAALGRDAWGGSCVNLTASDRPQDVYSRVLDTVRVKLAADAAQPAHSRSRTAAKLLQGGVNRKIVKQTVMTSVYGVTMIGARDQILARLQERADFVELFRPTGTMGEDDLHAAALYLAQLTLSSLFDAFSGARRIQDWLGDCAVRMAVVQQPVSWVTPLGLPVIQPYRQASLYTVQTAMQAVTIVDHNDLLPVSSMRQKSAFPPNFIHSLDASHMLMTAAECQRQGLTFASVHDSYWTHAGSMDTLSAALRQEFVHLYRQPILEQVRDAWVQRFPEIKFKDVPNRGDLDIAEVLKSPYFFN